jgi:hypothetical protein
VSDIRVGDLAMIVRGQRCCGYSAKLGLIFRVTNIYFRETHRERCAGCGAPSESDFVADSEMSHVWFVYKLKRIPPLDELERDQIVDELTA